MSAFASELFQPSTVTRRNYVRQDELQSPAEDSGTVRGLALCTSWRDPAGWVEGRVSVPGDDEETRHNKVLFTSAVILVTPALLVWAGLYFAYGEPAAAMIPVFFAVVTIAGGVVLFRFRRFAPFWRTELVVAFANSVAVQFVLGGFVGSGAVILWALLPVVAAVIFGKAWAGSWPQSACPSCSARSSDRSSVP